MKYLFSFFIIMALTNSISAQSTPSTTLGQLFIGMAEVDESDVIIHYIDAYGKVWEKIDDTFQISSNGQLYHNSQSTIGKYTNSLTNFNWSWDNNNNNPVWGLGVYMVSNGYSFFYLDTRDYEWANRERTLIWNPDLYYFVYRFSLNKYKFEYKGNSEINEGAVIRPSDLLGHTYVTQGLENFWENVLVVVEDANWKAQLIWGKHPTFNATHYKIYRALSDNPVAHPEFLTYTLLATVNSNIYNFVDPEITLYNPYPEKYAYYYVKAYNFNIASYSDGSNIVRADGEYQAMKRGLTRNNDSSVVFNLLSNYPNPFNPSTRIKYILEEDRQVNLSIYDIIGREVAVLVNEFQTSGEYNIEFNAENLSSGIYFARFLTQNKCMQIKLFLKK